jgi:ribosomal protein S18 acetylase RimI-like enzyme
MHLHMAFVSEYSADEECLMPRSEFIAADPRIHRDALIELNVEYVSWVLVGIEQLTGVPADRILGMPAREYVPTVIEKVCGEPPPRGIFYLVEVDGKLAGMGGLRPLGSGAVEVKRVYFRPEFRGMKLGDAMVERLIADAQSFGYERARLDTAPFMKAAQGIYERHGFTDCAAYAGVEVPAEFHTRWRFMERLLNHA